MCECVSLPGPISPLSVSCCCACQMCPASFVQKPKKTEQERNKAISARRQKVKEKRAEAKKTFNRQFAKYGPWLKGTTPFAG